MAIEKATGENLQIISARALATYGTQEDALWQMDSAGKGLKGLMLFGYQRPRFARFGKLYKDHGMWNGTRILDSTFVAQSLQPKYDNGPEYGYGWWLENYKGFRSFMMRGHLGQYVAVPRN